MIPDIASGKISIENLKQMGIDAAVGDIKYLIDNAYIFSDDKSYSNSQIFELGKRIAGGTAEIINAGLVTYGMAKSAGSISKRITGGLAKGTGNVLDNANFAQKTYGSTFSKDGIKIYSDLAGKPINTVDDLANALKNGTIKPQDVPIDYIVRDGNTLILNTRSSQALTQAGIPRSQWNAVNQTGNQLFEDMLTGQLSRNGLTSAGTPTVRISGGNK
ncbi:MAG: hypothetical protein GX660_07660 [Clostridiaceae bacterium]|nr:hypothetical protein [Clostridiaceae bacterium]